MAGPEPDEGLLDAALAAIRHGLKTGVRRPFVLGICGAQGCGKTTLSRHIVRSCEAGGLNAAMLSLDDLYRTRGEREELARSVHPLMRTRGVPGTHDPALGLRLLAAMERGEPVELPRFDKSADDRLPAREWQAVPAGCDVLVFEGWCVGARPQAAEDLDEPVNALEAEEDPEGVWRRHANDALAGGYQKLFKRIDYLLLLAAPAFETVFDWRLQQEADLRATSAPDAPGLMDADGVARFIQHYERLSRHILTEMPARADLTAWLDRDRRVVALESRGQGGPFNEGGRQRS